MTKVLTTTELCFINGIISRDGAARLPNDIVLRLDPAGFHVLQPMFPHNDGVEMRTKLLAKLDGQDDPYIVTGYDVPMSRWGKLRDYREEDWQTGEGDDK